MAKRSTTVTNTIRPVVKVTLNNPPVNTTAQPLIISRTSSRKGHKLSTFNTLFRRKENRTGVLLSLSVVAFVLV